MIIMLRGVGGVLEVKSEHVRGVLVRLVVQPPSIMVSEG
jgi:hypothetical protein